MTKGAIKTAVAKRTTKKAAAAKKVAGHRVVSVTYDGTRILQPVVKPSSFTNSEIRDAIKKVIERRKQNAGPNQRLQYAE